MSSTRDNGPLPTAPKPVDKERRITIMAAAAVGGAGLAATAVPFVMSFAPSERAKAAGAPVEVDLAGIAPGELRIVEWRGLPVWILHRTPEMLQSIKKVDADVVDPRSQRTAYPTPDYARNEYRSIKPQYLIMVGICTHLGCSPTGPFGAGGNAQLGAQPGFVCPCHGSTFDLAGRVFRNVPAPDNLPIPPHRYLSESVVMIGDDTQA